MADVGCEPRLALDAVLHGVGHVVERADEPVEVGIALGVEAGVQPPDASSLAASRPARPDGGAGGWPTTRPPRRARRPRRCRGRRPADHPEASGEGEGNTSKYWTSNSAMSTPTARYG